MSGPVSLPSTMRVLERGWLSSNNVLFLGREETALVDSGYATHAPQTLALVRHALGGRALDRLINTHLHSDHCGGNALLQQTWPCRTTIPAAEAGKVRDWSASELHYAAVGQQCPRFAFDDTMAPGEVLRLGDLDWEVIGSSGHDPHSLILYCAAERILISADALWEHGFGVIFPELEGESGFAETRATLQAIAALDVRLVIPGHGAPFADARRALDTAFSRLDYLEADPKRNAQNAVKVLLKFLLLERERVPLAELVPLMSGIGLFGESNRRYLHLSDDELARWATQQLLRAGAAAIENDTLVNL